MTLILPSDGPFFSRMFASRNAALVNRTRRIGSNTLLPFIEMVVESGNSVSCDAQLNGRTPFHNSNYTFAFILLQLFARLLFNLPMGKGAFSAELTSRFCFIELTFGRMPILTRRFGASTFQEVFTWRSIEFLRLGFCLVFLKIVAQNMVTFALDTSFPRRHSVSVSHDRYSHAGNCIGLPSNTDLFLSTGNKYLFLFQHHLIPCDS